MNATKPKLLNNWAIYPRPYSLNHPYWFCYGLKNGESSTEIRYKILIRQIPQKDESYLYLIHRISDIYINDKLPELCLEEIAYETGKVFYPMVIEVDDKLHWTALRNYNQIKNNWYSTIRPYVELRFGGEIGKEYLNKMDKVINQKERIENIFKNELLFKFFFNTFYHGYSHEFQINRVLHFPVGENQSTWFHVGCKLDRSLTEHGYKQITQNGISILKPISGKEDIIEDGLATYSARILLYTKSNYLRQAEAEWNFGADNRKVTLKIYPGRREHNDEIKIKVDKKESDNQGFFSKLFGE